MKKFSDSIDLSDILFIPGASILAYFLARWIPTPLAVAVSGVIFSLIFFLFETRRTTRKQFAITLFVAGVVAFTLTWLFDWLP